MAVLGGLSEMKDELPGSLTLAGNGDSLLLEVDIVSIDTCRA